MAGEARVRIGDLLVQKGLMTDAQLSQALEIQKKSGKKIGKVVVELNFVDETKLLQTLANHFKYPYVDLIRFRIDSELVDRKSVV